MPQEAFTSSVASDEALFTEYDAHPDKILIEDEGNQILSNWANTSYGKIVAKRYLKLFDCKPYQVSFMKNLKGGGESTVKCVPFTSTSVLIGATLNVANFQGLESADGLRRRFMTYLYDEAARTIYFPRGLEDGEVESIARGFEPLQRVAGTFKFSACGRAEFIRIQDENRAKGTGSGLTEAERSLLAGEPAFILKLAMIFAALRKANSANSTNSTGGEITGELLSIAKNHLKERLQDAASLNVISQKEAIACDADGVMDLIYADFAKDAEPDGTIILSQSQLTRKFCPNPSRDRAYRDSLYSKVIPYLIQKHLCQELPTQGKGRNFAFRGRLDGC